MAATTLFLRPNGQRSNNGEYLDRSWWFGQRIQGDLRNHVQNTLGCLRERASFLCGGFLKNIDLSSLPFKLSKHTVRGVWDVYSSLVHLRVGMTQVSRRTYVPPPHPTQGVAPLKICGNECEWRQRESKNMINMRIRRLLSPKDWEG